MITVVEKYRGVEILRDDSSVRIVSDIGTELAQPIVRYHAFPKGIKVTAQSIEAVRKLIDDALDVPPDSPAKNQ